MKKLSIGIIFFILLGVILSATAVAASYQSFARISDVPNTTLPDGQIATASEGMAVIGTYAYSVKLKGNTKPAGDTTNYHLNEPSRLFRTDLNSGETIQMIADDAEPDGNYVRYMHHANGLCALTIENKQYLFVATMVSGNQAIVKILIDGEHFSLAGQYEVMEDGVSASYAGIDILAADAEKAVFLLKDNERFYQAEIPHTQNSGTVTSTYLFDIDMSTLSTSTDTVDASSYTWQSCHYCNGYLYVPVSKGGESMIGVFYVLNEDGSFKDGTLTSVPEKSVRLGRSDSTQFEVEDCVVISKSTLIFNVNIKKAEDEHGDGIFYCKNPVDVAPAKFDTTPKEPETPAEPTPAPLPPAAPEPAPMLPFNILTLAAIAAAGAAVIGTVLYLILRKKKH